jgi:glycine cleavage system H protein
VSQQINRNDLLATLEAVKSISDIHSPITGKLVALNKKTEIINQDAENEGWLFELKLDSLLELSELLDKSEYEKYLKETMFY